MELDTINLFSLDDILSNVSEGYVLPIREAIKSITPEKHINKICFEPLVGGVSNAKLFKFTVENKKYVLRLLDETVPLEKRRSEISAHQIGASLNIAPKLYYADQNPLVLVMEFIEGRTLSRNDLSNPAIIKKVMQAIKKFHHYPLKENILRKTHIEMIRESYDRDITQNNVVFPSCYEQLLKNLQIHSASLNVQKTPSHGDFQPDNILIANDGNIYLIDWTESSLDDPFYDIGWFACCLAASNDHIKQLLQGYLGRRPNESETIKALFFRDVTMFYITSFWMGKQEERSRDKLDAILNLPLKKSTDHIIAGITKKDIAQKKGIDLTIHTLEWLKEFIDNQTAKHEIKKQKKFLLLAGVSGAGKSTIIQHLKKLDQRIVPIAPYTTRLPRLHEVDKIPISQQEMEQYEQQSERYIIDKCNGITYATSLEAIETALQNEQIPVLDCPLSRLNLMRNIFGEKLFCIYVAPPNKATHQARLADGRDKDGTRFLQGQKELNLFLQKAFDHIINKTIINHEGKAEQYAQEILEEIS